MISGYSRIRLVWSGVLVGSGFSISGFRSVPPLMALPTPLLQLLWPYLQLVREFVPVSASTQAICGPLPDASRGESGDWLGTFYLT